MGQVHISNKRLDNRCAAAQNMLSSRAGQQERSAGMSHGRRLGVSLCSIGYNLYLARDELDLRQGYADVQVEFLKYARCRLGFRVCICSRV
jgi:hypothetical protein